MAGLLKTRTIFILIQSVTSPFTVPYSYWALVVLYLHRKNWSTPSILIALIHWMFSALSVAFLTLDELYESYDEKNNSKGNWLISHVLSNCFNYSAQIIGDWYPMLLLASHDHMCRYIKLTCVITNISKLMFMGLYIFTPFTSQSAIKSSNFYEIRHYILIFISISTIIYHSTIFYFIRTRFCMKYKEIMKTQNFLTKFRRISQYRIMISSGYVLCSTPFIIFYIFIILFDKRKTENSGEFLRRTFFSVPYYIIYIDQLLLKNLVVVKPTSHSRPTHLYRNSGYSASDTDSRIEDHSSSFQHPQEVNPRPQVTARPMLFNNWSAPQGWGKAGYIKPTDKPANEPTDKSSSSQSSQLPQSTQPFQPSQLAQSSKPFQPSQLAQSSQPFQPSQLAQSTKLSQPSQSSQLTESNQP